jgi:hypothetical protein
MRIIATITLLNALMNCQRALFGTFMKLQQVKMALNRQLNILSELVETK